MADNFRIKIHTKSGQLLGGVMRGLSLSKVPSILRHVFNDADITERDVDTFSIVRFEGE